MLWTTSWSYFNNMNIKKISFQYYELQYITIQYYGPTNGGTVQTEHQKDIISILWTTIYNSSILQTAIGKITMNYSELQYITDHCYEPTNGGTVQTQVVM